jgi:hypothetical protein
MRIKLEPLMAIINYYNNYSPLFMYPSLLNKNAYWIAEFSKHNRHSGDSLLYSMDTQEIILITPPWETFLQQVADKSNATYLYFEQDMVKFMEKYPHETWFLPEIIQGELVND